MRRFDWVVTGLGGLFVRALAFLLALSAFGSGTGYANVLTFSNPMYYSLPLAFCLDGNEACGKPAADIWCGGKGYDEVMSFSRNTRLPRTIYRHADSKGICAGDENCFGFGLIKCIRLRQEMPSQQPGKATDWPGP